MSYFPDDIPYMSKEELKANGIGVFLDTKEIYEEVPYAYVIRFEGKVTVPVNNEEQALYEVKKALNKAVEPFEVWDGNKDYCNPEYGV